MNKSTSRAITLAYRLLREYDAEGALYAIRDLPSCYASKLRSLVYSAWKYGTVTKEALWILEEFQKEIAFAELDGSIYHEKFGGE